MSKLLVSVKQKLGGKYGVDMETAFRQIEQWGNSLVKYLGVADTPVGLVPAHTDVPVGGLVTSGAGPTIQTTYAAGSTNVITQTVNLISGHSYSVNVACQQLTQITNVSTGTNQLFVMDSSNYLPSFTGVKAFAISDQGLNLVTAGSGSYVITPTATGPDTFTVTLAIAANSGQIPANIPSAITYSIVRVA
jgi:hypothetical protein